MTIMRACRQTAAPGRVGCVAGAWFAVVPETTIRGSCTPLTAAALLTGCATTETIDGEINPDPYEDTNRSMYAFNDYLDRNIMIPIAENYVKATPEPVRNSVTNFFDNLEYLNVILHSFLQGKLGQGLSDLGRGPGRLPVRTFPRPVHRA